MIGYGEVLIRSILAEKYEPKDGRKWFDLLQRQSPPRQLCMSCSEPVDECECADHIDCDCCDDAEKPDMGAL